jgi:phosphoribosylformylglycinamidine synthase
MLWEVEIRPRGKDAERQRVAAEYDLLSHGHSDGALVIKGSARGYLLEGNLACEQAQRLVDGLLVDALVETASLTEVGSASNGTGGQACTVLLKPGVMDPAAQSVLDAALDLGIRLDAVRTFRRYFIDPDVLGRADAASTSFSTLVRVLANDAIESLITIPPSLDHLAISQEYSFRLITVPLRDMADDALVGISRTAQLSLSLPEMKAIQAYFRDLGRDPSDVELETLAQTWSEHCSHKTLKGRIDSRGRRYDNLLKETIFAATQELRRRLGPDDWCVSVFEDNAGVVRFDDRHNVCFKVETHNHPSAIEPYGGANTGLGGVIRDLLGTGLGAQPICNTDVFCFAPPGVDSADVPPGVLHPRKVISGVVAGVRDYGNRMGIPTVNGAVCFDRRYLANPLVFCGTVGVIPADRCHKEAKAGDLIVALGGRTGRDGIHGATFSSAELTSQSEKVSGGAVQIGNAITEKKLLDVLLQARDRGLYHAVTDCGAGGFSSAIGEMGERLGATVHLERAPLKYAGLSYTEIWISEAQERMVLAVPPGNWNILKAVCESEDVEATVLGTFEATGKLRLYFQDEKVADLDMHFLHHGRPPVVRQAMSPLRTDCSSPQVKEGIDLTHVLLRILSSPNVCSKEWIVRQYDHEVQGRMVIKPLVGLHDDGPGDAAVITPVLGADAGLAIGCGLNPRYGDIDPYAMAAAAVDEAARNVIAVGADPARVALLDNFCWGNTDRPEVLGSLVQAAEACRDTALAYGMPFISGKDSLNNEFHSANTHLVIPPTLLISAMGRVPDVRKCVTMDLKLPGNLLFLIGTTREEMGGSHFHLVNGLEGSTVPRPNLEVALRIFQILHEAIRNGWVRSCHDLSEGGLAVALAEMAFAGGVGVDVTLPAADGLSDATLLFSESTTRFVIEVAPEHAAAVERCFAGAPLARIGQTVSKPCLRIAGHGGNGIVEASLIDLKEAWQKPLRW